MSVSTLSYADTFEPLPHCYKPTKPLLLSTRYHKARYDRDVQEYQRCIKAFITEQEEAIKIHTQAMQKALNSWQEFSQTK